MSASPEARALPLTDAIYAAAVDPRAWNRFLGALARELGDAAIAMSIMFPGWNRPPEYFRVNMTGKYTPAFERVFRQGRLPWPMTDPLFRGVFARGNVLFPDERLVETEIYTDYMQPEGLAPEAPIAHLIASTEGRPVSGISIFRRVGGRHLTESDVAMCNLLVPHLAAATAVRNELVRAEQERVARTEILDRIPTGILVLDHMKRAVLSNRVAQEILDAADGLHVRHGVLHAARARDERELQRLIRAAIRFDEDPSTPPFEPAYLAVGRRSGLPSFGVAVTRLFSSPKHSAVGDGVAAVFIANPAIGQIALADTFREHYDLTRAEAETVALLAAGHSLDAISDLRGVTLHTTRSLLKRIFAKTRTHRQGEIVRLVLAEVANLGDAGSGSDSD